MRLIPLLLLLLLLAGCSSAPPRQLPNDSQLAWQERQYRLASLTDWRLTGRLAIQSGHEAWHARISWAQDSQNYTIELIAPLGQGSLRLDGDNRTVTLLTDKGESVSATDPGALLQQQFGWRVPVAALRYWVLGVPAPGARQEQLDEYGRLSQLEQGEWKIQFLDYRQHQGLELPGRVFVNNHQAKVKLVISAWEFGTAP
ncbi:MAG: lipoprotein insertase outer membrane protein LolB [Gammaproteobacteria bacterium]|nr:lipoprotein insertase outer membrane protein LolB [Gammaproteobacteria bacterium]MCW8972149.1 lipoprotein insertase outer membrane protein LolB [Gammaproteobacteria bacterium]MCW8992444.1 lipoprotein insertase outer membrane protein LolB [Gammaproteobacteria bacterium]